MYCGVSLRYSIYSMSGPNDINHEYGPLGIPMHKTVCDCTIRDMWYGLPAFLLTEEIRYGAFLFL